MTAPRTHTRLADRLDGLLFFPVTAFGPDGSVDLDTYRLHLKARLAAGPAAIFAACGTGEFVPLGLDEYAAVVRVAVEEAAGRGPVISGTRHGPAPAPRDARAAPAAGPGRPLVLPP